MNNNISGNSNSHMTSNMNNTLLSNMNSNLDNPNNLNALSGSNANAMLKLSDRDKMLMLVQAYEFALVEVGLFLDTHPNDRTALAYFKQYRELKHQAVSEYTRRFGPITMDHMENDLSSWKWIDNPWPWEIGSEG